MNQLSKKNDLEERTAKFGEDVVDFCRLLKKDVVITQLISQLVRSATSVGANYMEAQCASSRKETHELTLIFQKITMTLDANSVKAGMS